MLTNAVTYVVLMKHRGDWHAVWSELGKGWDAALVAHGAAINTLRVLDHPDAERVKILPVGAERTLPGLAVPVEQLSADHAALYLGLREEHERWSTTTPLS